MTLDSYLNHCMVKNSCYNLFCHRNLANKFYTDNKLFPPPHHKRKGRNAHVHKLVFAFEKVLPHHNSPVAGWMIPHKQFTYSVFLSQETDKNKFISCYYLKLISWAAMTNGQIVCIGVRFIYLLSISTIYLCIPLSSLTSSIPDG
jgi:hypothetical protein